MLAGQMPHCPACGQPYPTFEPAPTVRYLCLRCDSPVPVGPPDSGDTMTGTTTAYVYPAVTPPPGPPRQAAVRTIGRYQVRGELGRGGMGVVYRAFDADLGREVALKLLLAGEYATQDHVERFLREARAAARVEHPNLVRVHEIGWADGRAYFTMDLVEGPSLQSVLRRRTTLPPREVARISAAIGRALAMAHDRGLIHRDVKPGNILFRTDGTPLLADFGLAMQVDDERRLTRTGQIMGTPAYLAPETTRGEISHHSDQYALGAVMYEALAGVMPYGDVTAQEMLYAVMEGPPRPLDRIAPRVSGELAVVVATAMARDPADRYPTCRHLADDLDRWLRGEPILARPPGPWRRARAWVGRNRRFLAAVTLGLAGGLVLLRGVESVRAGLERRQVAAREAEAVRMLAGTQARARDLEAEGKSAEARELLTELARRPEVDGTRAATLAWGDAAEMASAAGDRPGALQAWAEAWLTAGGAPEQDRALRGLEIEFAASWRWASLSRVVERHVALTPSATTDPALASLAADAAFAQRRLADAAPFLEVAERRGAGLARRMAQGTRVALSPVGGAFDGDGDGISDWWGVDRVTGEVTRTRGVPGLPTEVVGRWPGIDRAVPLPGDPQVLALSFVSDGDSRIELWRLGGPEPVLVDRFREGAPMSVMAASDGTTRLAIGPYDRHLLRLTRNADGTFTRDLPSPRVDLLNSDVQAVLAADLDGQDPLETVVVLGPWTAYDIRAYHGLPDGPDAQPAARRKIGMLDSVALAPGTPATIWALHSEIYPSTTLFPADAPFGEPAGASRLALVGDRLATERFLPGAAPAGVNRHLERLVVADLDGNGKPEVVYDSHPTTEAVALVIHPDGEDGPPLIMAQVNVLFAAQLDDDPEQELLVDFWASPTERQTWALGTGTEGVPPAPPLGRPLPAPAELPAMRRPSWERAEDLVAMGLDEAAAGEFERLADAWVGRPESIAARRRQAALLPKERAADALKRVVDAGGSAPDRLAAAATLVELHRYEEASTILQPVDLPAARQLLAPFAEEVAATRHLTVRPGDLPPEADVLAPLALVPVEGGRARVSASVNGAPVLEIPVELTGGRIGFDLELELQRLEWGAGLEFELVDPQGAVAANVTLRAWGGGGLIERELDCYIHGERVTTRVVDGSPIDRRTAAHLSVDLSEAGGWRCAVGLDDESATASGPHATLARGRWTWRLRPLELHVGARSQAVVEIGPVELVGTLAPSPVHDPRADALRAWVRGVLPATAPRGYELEFAAALADAGRTAEAVTLVRALPRPTHDDDGRERAVEMLRARLATFGPVLDAAWGDAWLEVFYGAWSVPLEAHPNDAETLMALTTGLSGIEDRLVRLDGEARIHAAKLLLGRGRAWTLLGQPGAAIRDLERATVELERTKGDDDRLLRRTVALAWLDHADRSAQRGDMTSAAQAVEQVRRAALLPEIADDLVATRPSLASLRRGETPTD